jgi:hypothetical protein
VAGVEQAGDAVQQAAAGRRRQGAVARAMVERLREQQTERDRWHQRGRRDGEVWALELAPLEELRLADEWDDFDGDLQEFEEGDVDGWEAELPASFPLWDALAKWEGHERVEEQWRLKAAYLWGWHRSARDMWRAASHRLR